MRSLSVLFVLRRIPLLPLLGLLRGCRQMAVQRIQLLNNKRFESAKQKKRAIGNLLAENKEDKAVIQVEHIIREDYTREGYEILELVLELLHERIRRITTNETCPEDMMETVCCAIWAADNVDIDELQQVKSQLQKKFGREFVRDAPNSDKAKASRLANKLTYKVPSSDLIMSYLTVISESLKVGWTPSTKCKRTRRCFRTVTTRTTLLLLTPCILQCLRKWQSGKWMSRIRRMATMMARAAEAV